MKTFKDLEFVKHPIASEHYVISRNAKQAILNFDNGYGVSVIFGECFYSNGIDTYELAVLDKGVITYKSGITEDVLGHLTESNITAIMEKVQLLKKGEQNQNNPGQCKKLKSLLSNILMNSEF